MIVDLDALERLAAEATPGPWETVEPGVGGPKLYVQQAREKMMGTPVAATRSSGLNKHAAEDAAFIAACDPVTVAALIQAARALEHIADRDSVFDDLDPHDGLHGTSVRDFARAALAPFREPPA